MRNIITDEILKEAYEEYKKGNFIVDVAKKYNIHRNVLYAKLKKTYIEDFSFKIVKDEDVHIIVDRHNKGESVADIAKSYGVEVNTIKRRVKQLYPNYTFNKFLISSEVVSNIIELYKTGEYTGDKINKMIPIFSFERLSNLFLNHGIVLYKDKNYFGNIYVSDLDYNLINEYMNTDVTYEYLSKKYNVSLYYLNTRLKDVAQYRQTLPYLMQILEKLKELKQIKKVAEYFGLTKKTINRNLKHLGFPYKEYIEFKSDKPKKETKVKPKEMKKKTVKPKPTKVKKSNTKVGKKVEDIRMFAAEKMQKGEVKIPKKSKVFETLPKEKHNAGYLLRIDAKTEIYVKEGASPDVARQRYFERLEKRKD